MHKEIFFSGPKYFILAHNAQSDRSAPAHSLASLILYQIITYLFIPFSSFLAYSDREREMILLHSTLQLVNLKLDLELVTLL